MDEPHLVSAYTDIGKAVVKWGHFDQTIIAQTWRSRDPLHMSPFREGPIERGFYKRWLEWCRIFDAPEDLKLSVLDLSTFRDDLSHNIIEIHESSSSYILSIWRRHFDWRKGWAIWVQKYVKLHWKARPAPPKEVEHLNYRLNEVRQFTLDVIEAEARITEIADAWLRAQRA